MKATASTHSILNSLQGNEWQAGINLWYNAEFETNEAETSRCYSYSVPLVAGMPETASEDLFGDIGFWGTTYNLKCLRIYKGTAEVYIYLETSKLTDISFLLEIVGRVLKSDSVPTEVTNSDHSENGELQKNN